MRTLTVTKMHRASGHIARPRWTAVPQIRMSGHWLASAGFSAGSRLQVEIRDGALVITAK